MGREWKINYMIKREKMSLKIKNKGGFLLGDKTISIVISIIAVIIRVFLGAKMYSATLGNKHELEQARGSLDRIKNYVEIAENAPGIEKEFFIESPNGWYITSWPENGKFPKKCYEQFGYKGYCYCICEGDSLEKCDKRSICEYSDKKLIILTLGGQGRYGTLKIEGITALSMEFDSSNQGHFTLRKKN